MINKDKLIKRLNDFTPEELADFLYNVAPCEFCISDVPACELCGNDGSDYCIKYIKEWLEKEAKPEQTADDMFEEMEYVKIKDTKEYKQYKKDHLFIDIFKYDMDKNAWAYIKSKREPYEDMEFPMPIHESEDKAIHKKLEELKKEAEND